MQRMASTMVLVVLCAACGVRLDPKVPHDLGARRDGTVGSRDTARGMPARVGWGTFTVFAIPVAPVHIENGQGEKIVMDKIRETLTPAGYPVGDAKGVGDGPALRV